LPGDDKVRDATIAILQFERWKTPFRSVAIFEDQEEVNRKVLVLDCTNTRYSAQDSTCAPHPPSPRLYGGGSSKAWHVSCSPSSSIIASKH
jgi:hypothetical protein